MREFLEQLTVASYRIAIYWHNNIMDDAAMLSILFC
jgi:hypothetical protein